VRWRQVQLPLWQVLLVGCAILHFKCRSGCGGDLRYAAFAPLAGVAVLCHWP
jgi:hypothetical protein